MRLRRGGREAAPSRSISGIREGAGRVRFFRVALRLEERPVSGIARLVSLALLAILALTLAARAHATRADATLNAKVGPSFSIALTDSTGATVSHLNPGTYTI